MCALARAFLLFFFHRLLAPQIFLVLSKSFSNVMQFSTMKMQRSKRTTMQLKAYGDLPYIVVCVDFNKVRIEKKRGLSIFHPIHKI